MKAFTPDRAASPDSVRQIPANAFNADGKLDRVTDAPSDDLRRSSRIRVKFTLEVERKGASRIISGEMMRNPPSPQHGYTDSKVVGEPHDSSSHAQITQRWETLKICKEQFRLIIDAAYLTKLMPPSTPWDLSVAPVAHPGTSKHGTGYAVDIEGYGLNRRIREISKSLGATLVFHEKSHVHVEFAKGVKVPDIGD